MSSYSPYLSYISLYLPVGAAGDLAAKKTFPFALQALPRLELGSGLGSGSGLGRSACCAARSLP